MSLLDVSIQELEKIYEKNKDYKQLLAKHFQLLSIIAQRKEIIMLNAKVSKSSINNIAPYLIKILQCLYAISLCYEKLGNYYDAIIYQQAIEKIIRQIICPQNEEKADITDATIFLCIANNSILLAPIQQLQQQLIKKTSPQEDIKEAEQHCSHKRFVDEVASRQRVLLWHKKQAAVDVTNLLVLDNLSDAHTKLAHAAFNAAQALKFTLDEKCPADTKDKTPNSAAYLTLAATEIQEAIELDQHILEVCENPMVILNAHWRLANAFLFLADESFNITHRKIYFLSAINYLEKAIVIDTRQTDKIGGVLDKKFHARLRYAKEQLAAFEQTSTTTANAHQFMMKTGVSMAAPADTPSADNATAPAVCSTYRI